MTTSDASRYLTAVRESVADVDALALTGSDRAVVLGVTLAARLGLTLAPPAGVTLPANTVAAGPPFTASDTPATTAAGLLGKIGSVAKLDAETVELIWDAHGDELGYVISPKRLAAGKAEATRQLAKVVILGRQAAGQTGPRPA